jgi:hypothetical protein
MSVNHVLRLFRPATRAAVPALLLLRKAQQCLRFLLDASKPRRGGSHVASNKRGLVRAVCASIATGAVAAMAVLVVVQDQERTRAAPHMNVGDTTTQTSVPGSVAATPNASPTFKAQRPNGFY